MIRFYSHCLRRKAFDLCRMFHIFLLLNITIFTADILNLSLTPVGTVIGWLRGKYLPIPPGWQKCDGSEIWSGPMEGGNTPNLIVGGYFLRGAPMTDAWTIQADMIMQHGHNINDPGHKNTDSGRSHGYYDRYDSGALYHAGGCIRARDNEYNDLNRDTHSSRANIRSAYTGIKVLDITGTNTTTAHETRPKNIAVEWIIRILHLLSLFVIIALNYYCCCFCQPEM